MPMAMPVALWTLLLLFCLSGCGGLTLPPPTPLHRGGPDAADYPDSAAIVLADEATLSYRVMEPPTGGPARLVAVLDHYRRTKVLRREGVSVATLKLPVDGLSTVTQVVGRTMNLAGETTTLKSRDIHLRRAHENEAVAPEIRVLSAVLPEASLGGTVEFRYQRVFLDPWNVPVWTYGGPLPVLHAFFGVVADDGIEVDFLHGRGDQAVDRSPSDRDTFDGRPRLRFIETSIPPYFAEQDGSHLAHRSPWTLAALRVARLEGRIERMNSWSEAGRHVLSQMAVSEPVHGSGPLLERLAYVRRTLLPQVGWGLGVRTPQSASALKIGTPACSRDATAFARGLLSDSPKEVEVVLVTGPDSPPFAESFTSLAPFSKAMLRVRAQPGMKDGLACSGDARQQDFLCAAAPGDWLLVDPACQSCGIGMVTPGLAGSRALAIEASGHARWFDVDQGGPERHALLSQFHYALDVDGGLRGSLSAQAHGQLASFWRQALAQADAGSGSREAQTDPVHYRALFGDRAGPATSGLSVKGISSPERQLSVQAGLTAKLAPVGAHGQGLVPAELFGTSFPSHWHSGRQDVLVTDGPSWRDMTATISVPLATSVSVPPPIKVVNAGFEYAAGFAFEGRTLRYARRLVVKSARIAAGDWPVVYEGIQAIRTAETRPLTVQFRSD